MRNSAFCIMVGAMVLVSLLRAATAQAAETQWPQLEAVYGDSVNYVKITSYIGQNDAAIEMDAANQTNVLRGNRLDVT